MLPSMLLTLLLCSAVYATDTLDDETKEEARYALHLSESAYERFTGEHVFHKWTPKFNSAEPTWGIVLKELNGRQQISLAFKGTDSPRDLFIDFFESGATLNEKLNINVHKGMNTALQKVQKEIIFKLFDVWMKSAESKTPLMITGHSLGGGYAQILGAYLKDDNFLNREVEKILWDFEKESCWHCFNGCYRWCMNKYYALENFKSFLKDSKIYTFGSPQVFRLNHTKNGNDTPQWKDSVESSSFHFVNERDPVPLLNLLAERGLSEALVDASKEKGSVWGKLSKFASDMAHKLTRDCTWKEWGHILFFNSDKWEKTDLSDLKTEAGGLLNYAEISNWKETMKNKFVEKSQNIKFHSLQKYKENFVHL